MRNIALGVAIWLLSFASAAAFSCAGVKLPWDIVVCGNPELQMLADQRLEASEQAKARLSPEQTEQLRQDQSAWVHSYSASCGILGDRAPPLPISTEIIDCFRRAGQARLAYLRAYAAEDKNRDAHADETKEYTGPFTTKVFYTMCSRDDRISRDTCDAYIQGLMYGLNVSRSLQGKLQVCLPEMSTETARLRILDFINGTTGGKPEENRKRTVMAEIGWHLWVLPLEIFVNNNNFVRYPGMGGLQMRIMSALGVIAVSMSMSACAANRSPPPAQSPPPLATKQVPPLLSTKQENDAAMKAVVACLMTEDHDDGISDAATIGRALVSACDREFTASYNTFLPTGWDKDQDLVNKANNHWTNAAITFVLHQRGLVERAKRCTDQATNVASCCCLQPSGLARISA